jgi:hypothetical protein
MPPISSPGSGPDERFATPLFDADRSVSILDDESPCIERNAAFLMEFLESVQPLVRGVLGIKNCNQHLIHD